MLCLLSKVGIGDAYEIHYALLVKGYRDIMTAGNAVSVLAEGDTVVVYMGIRLFYHVLRLRLTYKVLDIGYSGYLWSYAVYIAVAGLYGDPSYKTTYATSSVFTVLCLSEKTMHFFAKTSNLPFATR